MALKELLEMVEQKTPTDNRKRLSMGKWKAFTIQYQSGIGIYGLNTRVTIWRYDEKCLDVETKRLTINDEAKVKVRGTSYFLSDDDIDELMRRVENDEIIGIGSIQLMWRITLGGRRAKGRANLASEGL